MIQASTPITTTPIVDTETPRIRLLTNAVRTEPICSAVW